MHLTKMLPTAMLSLAFLGLVPVIAEATVKTEKVIYKDGDIEFEGFLAYDDAKKGKKPGVLIVHEWMGPGKYTDMRAKQLAAEGYVAFAADIFGTKLRPKNVDEAGKASGQFKADRQLLRTRVELALEQLRKAKNVDTAKLAAIGYCFGGTSVLELARSGNPIAGVVSFHGDLSSAKGVETNVKTKVLALHGAIDPYVPAEQVMSFEKEMTNAKADWQLVAYSNAVHGFTNPENGNDNSKGAAYNELADKRSWVAMKSFFNEIFK